MDIDDLFRKAGDALRVGRSFGPAYEHEGTLVIPVAVVAGGGGGGGSARGSLGGPDGAGGHGGGGDPDGVAALDSLDEDRRHEEGSGGGFGGFVYPVGAYVVREGRARFVPSVDVNLIVLCGLLLGRLVVKRRRQRRRRRQR